MATMIQSVDDGVGKILAALDRLELTSKTVVMFCSDNGGYGPVTDMAPLKGYKGSYYEGGIRVPFFVNWPGVVKRGSKTNTPIIGVDVFPTICEIAGARRPDLHILDGVSIVDLLRGEKHELNDRALYWHFPAYLESYKKVTDEQGDPLFRSRPCSCIRYENWKLHQFFEDGRTELYDLAVDIGEARNMAESFPKKRDELLRKLKNWQLATGADIPTEKNILFSADAESLAVEKQLRGKE